MNETTPNVTCSDYRAEMVLLALRRRLESAALTERERETIKLEIARLEREMGLD